MSYPDLLQELSKFRQAYYCNEEKADYLSKLSNSSRRSNSPIIINNNPSPMYIPTQQPVIVNNNIGETKLRHKSNDSDSDNIKLNDKKKKSKKSDKTKKSNEENKASNTKLILYAIPIAVGTFGSLYTASQDEYVKLIRSDIKEQIRAVNDSQLRFHFEAWLHEYENRTHPGLVAKFSSLVSTVCMGYGFYDNNNSTKTVGFFGLLASTGYLFWRYLTYEINKEKKLFEQLYNYVLSKAYVVVDRGHQK